MKISNLNKVLLSVLVIASVFSYKANVKAGNIGAGLQINGNENLNEYYVTGVRYQGSCPGFNYIAKQKFRFIDKEIPASKGLKVMLVNEHTNFKNEPYTIKNYDEKNGYSELHEIDGLYSQGKNDNDYIKIGPGKNNFRYYIYTGKDDKDGRQPKIGKSQIIKQGEFSITPVVQTQNQIREIEWKQKTYYYDEKSPYTNSHLDTCLLEGSRVASVEYGYCDGIKVSERNFRLDNRLNNGSDTVIIFN